MSPVAAFRWVRHGRGLSLVELLVGLTLGALLVMACMGLWLATRSSTEALVGRTALQSQAQHTLALLTQQLRQAGALELRGPPGAWTPLQRVAFSSQWDGLDVNGDGVRDGVALWGEEGGLRPDALSVSFEYRSASTTPDCLGAAPAAGSSRVDSRFAVVSGVLRCLGSGNSAAQPISNQVDDFQLHYWLRDGAGSSMQHQLLQADQLAGRWSQVVAVVLCLQWVADPRAADRTLAGTRRDAAQAKAALDCQEAPWPDDGRMRLTLRRTVFLQGRGSLF